MALTLFMMSPAACAASDLRETTDCPIAKPFEPGYRIQNTADMQSIIYPMQGYKLSRIQILSSEKADIKIIWTPVEKFWGEQSANVSVSENTTLCVLTDSFPVHTPAKQIEIRTKQKIEGLKVFFSDVPWDYEGECQAKALCPVFLRTMNQCKTRPDATACHGFIEYLHNLTSRNQCRREFDTGPVPAIWLCDGITNENDILGDAMHLLKSLKFKKAIDFYESSEFRGVLDGEYAEEYDGL
jgi:hypothetical protein